MVALRAEPPRASPLAVGGLARGAIDRWALAWGALAVGISLLPVALSACCAPADRSGLGSVWFVNDFAQYESAMRQGAQRADWLVQDPFTAEPHAPAFMFPLYVGIGKLAAALAVPALPLERLVELIARALFVMALWRFSKRFTPSLPAARAAFLLALFGGGLGLFSTLLGAALRVSQPYSGNWSYELTTFGLLFAAPHVPLAMAGTLELAGWLRGGRRATPGGLLWAAGLGAALALLHPFHVPVLLGALGLAGLVWWRAGAGAGALAAAGAAAAGALPALAPTLATFTLDPFWGAAYTRQNVLPSPAPHELLVDLGVVLIWAVIGVWALRSRSAPFGLLLWAMLALVAMYLPVPYQRRLAFGLQPMLAVIAATALVGLRPVSEMHARALRLGTALLAGATSTLVAVSVVLALLTGAPLGIYRSTPDLDAAAVWLSSRVASDEAILADWDVGNYLAPRTDGRVFGGHPVATLDAAEKRLFVQTYFAHAGSVDFARQLGVAWVVYGPAQAVATGLPVQPAFQAGAVRVYRVAEGG